MRPAEEDEDEAACSPTANPHVSPATNIDSQARIRSVPAPPNLVQSASCANDIRPPRGAPVPGCSNIRQPPVPESNNQHPNTLPACFWISRFSILLRFELGILPPLRSAPVPGCSNIRQPAVPESNN